MASITPVISGTTRTNLGPFTTHTWTYTCTEAIQNHDDGGWEAQTCIEEGDDSRPTDNQDCWPPRQKGVPETSEGVAGWGVYSPGIQCPGGYTSVAGSTYGGSANFRFFFPITAGETAIGCCPEGGFYHSLARKDGAQTCVQSQALTTFYVGTCQGSTPVYTPFAVPGSLDKHYNEFTVRAPFFQMVHQSSDLPATPSSSPSPSSSSSSSNIPNSGGLTPGATAGIAVGAVFAVIIAATVAFCVWRSRRRIFSGVPQGANLEEQQSPGAGVAAAEVFRTTPSSVNNVVHKGPVEADSSAVLAEMSSGHGEQRFELGGNQEYYR
ncbi:hypothetical protein GGS20DRAFT_442054 [Poronia punctata]|nr:hypothetical protein GGS20DRAFT_442054 [Poronia punctata]